MSDPIIPRPRLEVRVVNPSITTKLMKLDTIKIGTGLIGPRPPSAYVWMDLGMHANEIETFEGSRADDASAPPVPGSLSASFVNAPDFTDLGIARATEIRLVYPHPLGGDVIYWAGWVDKYRDSWDKFTDTKRTTLTAFDLAALLGSITRYGFRRAGSDVRELSSVSTYFIALAASSPVALTTDIAEIGEYGDLEDVTNTVRETSLLNMFHMGASAVASYLFVDSIARRVSTNGRTLRPTRRFVDSFTDTRIPASERTGASSFYTLDLGSPGDVPTRIEVTGHEIGDDGNTRDTTFTYINNAAEQQFGVQTSTLDVNAPPDALERIGLAFGSTTSSMDLAPVSITVEGSALVRQYLPLAGQPWDTVRPLDRVVVWHRGKSYYVSVASVSQRFSINKHQNIRLRTTLSFIRR